MRTKIGKRIGPVPIAVVAALALAAFISAGLWLVPGGQTAEAQSTCTVEHGTQVTATEQRCSSGVSSFTLTVENSGDTPVTVYAYASGGSDNTGVTLGEKSGVTGKKGFNLYTSDSLLPAAAGQTAESYDISISSSMANDDGDVVIIFYPGGTLPSINTAGTLLEGGTESGSAIVTFLGAPVKKGDHDADPSNDDVVTSASVVTAAEANITNIIVDASGGIDDNITQITNVAANTESVRVTAEFNDARLRNIVDNIQFTVTPTTEAPNVAFKGGGTSRTVFSNHIGGFDVINLPKKGAFSVPVTATIMADSGNLTLEKKIVRLGEAHTVTVMAYGCTKKVDASDSVVAPDTDTDICGTERAALRTDPTSDDPKPVGPLKSGDMFFYTSEVKDELGTKLIAATTTGAAEGTTAEKAATTAAFSSLEDTIIGPPETPATITVNTAAEKGTHKIKVSSGNASAILTLSVSGTPETYELSGDMWIPLDGEKTYTVTAKDEFGNVPIAPTGGYDVIVRVRGVGFDRTKDVVGLDATTGELTINVAKGTGKFTILAPAGITQGASATIRVLVGDGVKDTMTVYFGEEITYPAAPMNVTAMANSSTEVTVSWDAVSDADSYHVWRGKADDASRMMYIVANGITETSYKDTGLTPDTAYNYAVTGVNAGYYNNFSDTVTVTTLAAMLTAPTGLEAGYVPLTESISLSWTPGAGASRQMIVLLDAAGNVVFFETVAADVKVADIEEDRYGNSLLSGDYMLYVLSISGTDFEHASVSVTVPAN